MPHDHGLPAAVRFCIPRRNHTAFYSAVIPFALLSEGGDSALLVLVATLGAVVNWLLVWYLLRFQGLCWFYFSRSQIDEAQRRFQRYGFWSLLLAWHRLMEMR